MIRPAISYPHVTVGADGVARIDDTRYKVAHLAGEHYHYGWTAEELLRQHPDLRPEEIYGALTYFYDHYQEMVDQLVKNGESESSPPLTANLTREELLQRRNAGAP